MALINMTLQGKGGVGKSFVNSLLAQYYMKRESPLQGFDTDPVNQTFAGYKAFPVKVVKLGERIDEIDPRYFDDLIEDLVELPEDGVAVIDNGASTFMPLLNYLVESQVIEMLQDAGHQVRLHSVIIGGQALDDTMNGLAAILTYLPSVPVVVWLNEYFGKIERTVPGAAPIPFDKSSLYKNNKDRLYGLVRLPDVRKETFGRDIEDMMRARLTFDEAVASEDFKIMARQRLKNTWRVLDDAMEKAML